jgi:microcystin degradation protein MlrC
MQVRWTSTAALPHPDTAHVARPIRLALAGISHETNTFSVVPADLAWFADEGILRGDEVRAAYATSQADVAGFLAAEATFGVTVEPLLFTYANPSGTITADAFETIVGEIVERIEREGPWDGVLLAQHGAAVSERFRDADGEVVRRVRAVVGPDVPIGMTNDMHANVSREMIAGTTVTTIYRTNPHLDARDRGLECAGLIVRTIRGEIRPVQALEQIPAAIEIVRQYTAVSPMREICADLDTVLARPGVLTASVAEGYPWADVDEMGMAMLVATDGDEPAARDAARWLAERAWARRAEFVGREPTADDALRSADRAASGSPGGPIVLMDVGDNIGGGGPGDSTILLEAAQRLGIRGFLCILFDPAAVAACVATGEGGTVTLDVGARTDDRHGRPVHVTGTVRRLSEGRWEDPEPVHGGYRFFDAGRTAVIATTDGATIVLTTRLIAPVSLAQLPSAGVDPREPRIIAAKGVVSPRPAYGRVAAAIVLVDTPGVTANDLRGFEYRHRRRPLFPLEPAAPYPAPD